MGGSSPSVEANVSDEGVIEMQAGVEVEVGGVLLLWVGVALFAAGVELFVAGVELAFLVFEI